MPKSFSSHRVTVKIYSLSLFMALMVGFAFLFQTILDPEDFNWPSDVDNKPTFTDYLYFSSTTFSSVGYGDITPKTERARRWVTIQQISMVLVISFLIIT